MRRRKVVSAILERLYYLFQFPFPRPLIPGIGLAACLSASVSLARQAPPAAEPANIIRPRQEWFYQQLGRPHERIPPQIRIKASGQFRQSEQQSARGVDTTVEDAPSNGSPQQAESPAAPKSVPARSDPGEASGSKRMADLERQMWALVNRDRQDPANAAETHGRARPLRWNRKLAAVARAHSLDMMEHRYFSHVDPQGRTPVDRINAAGIHWSALAENIAVNRTVADAEASLMDEPRFRKNHRGNILDPEYTDVGIGIVQAPNGDLYITQDFAAIPPRRTGARSR